jgi:peptidoglycan/LPS O-acetylase OafA/YrhL
MDKAASKLDRLYSVDWLRVLATLAVFYFHNARFYDLEGWHVKNNQLHVGFTVFVAFTWQWIMPLFFVLSGVGSLFALRRRSAGQYVIERFKRLAVPYLMGIFILIPPQRYVEALSNARFSGSYLEFFLSSFRFDYIGWSFNFLGHYGTHLWFIGLLFFLSLIALPLLLHLNNESGQRFISQLAAISERPGGIFVFVIPIALIQMMLRAPFPGECNWADFFYYLALFVSGYIIWSDRRFEEAIARHGNIALLIGIASFSAIGAWYAAGNLESVIDNPQYSMEFIFLQFLFSLSTWSWLVFIISIGIKFLNFSSKGLEYANEAVLPFYILHQTVILIVGFYIVQWNVGMLIKYFLISTISLGVIIALYDLCVRRTNVTRFLFGMRPKKQMVQKA